MRHNSMKYRTPLLLTALVALLVALVLLVVFSRRRCREPMMTLEAQADIQSIVIPTPGMKQLTPSAYVKTAQPLRCPRQGGGGSCTFGIYVLSGKSFDGDDVKVTLSDHLAGAVYKITYGRTEFVHPVPIVGASLQTAMSFDARAGGSAEQMNPTEAGCGELDSFTGKSSSRMLDLRAGERSVYTSTRPAYFRKPGAKLVRHGRTIDVLNKTVLSDVEMSKQLTFVSPGVLDYVVTVKIPGDKYYFSQIAYVSAWVPWASSSVMQIYTDGRWTDMPAVTRTAKGFVVSDGVKAMGVSVVDAPRGGMWTPGYYGNLSKKVGEWRHWNLVQKVGHTKNYTEKIPGGVYAWRARFYFGTLGRVKQTIQGL